MADTIASLTAIIGADITGLQAGLDKAKGGLSGLSASMRQTGAALTAGLTVPILGFLGASVKAASDNETAMAQLNAVLKSTGGAAGVTAKQAEALAESLDKTTRFSKDAVLSTEDLLLTFTNIGKNIFPDVTKATLDMSQALGEDTKSAAIQLGKALQDPIKGITALKRVGVDFTDAQKQQIEGLVKAGKLEQAQTIILKELQREFGGSAAAAGKTFAGQMDILNHNFNDFQEKVGGIIIPILSDFMKHISDLVSGLNNLNPNILRIGIVAGVALAALGPILGILGSIGAVIGIILSPIGLLVAAVAALAVAWATDFGGIREKVLPVLKDISNFVTQTVIPALQKLWKDVQPALQSFANWFLKDALPWIIATVEFFILSTWNPLVKAIQEFWTLVSPALTQFSNWFSQNIGPIITQIQQLIDKFNVASSTLSKGLNLPSNSVGNAAASILTPVTASSGGSNLGFNLGAQLHNALFGGFASGGYTGDGAGPAGVVHGGEYVVPRNGTLVSSGPGTIHVVLQAHNFEDHIYVNIAQAIGAGTG